MLKDMGATIFIFFTLELFIFKNLWNYEEVSCYFIYTCTYVIFIFNFKCYLKGVPNANICLTF
jgi:hypothetical protein